MVVEMVICSFALHLIESSSELFSLLWELRYVDGHICLVESLAKTSQHKMSLPDRPRTTQEARGEYWVLAHSSIIVNYNVQIKDGWGWTKWDVDAWNECRPSESKGELLQDRYVLCYNYVWWVKLTWSVLGCIAAYIAV